jgi:exopolysaccharide biosynthesis polyprenyl glycosylphosphotransferase
MFKEYHKYKLALIMADFWVTMAMLMLTEHFRPLLPGKPIDLPFIVPHYSVYFFAPFLLHVLFALTGVYHYKRLPKLSLQIARFTFAYSLGIWVFAGLLFFTFRDTSRLLVIYFASSNYIILVGVRYLLSKKLKNNSSRVDAARVLIFGIGDNATALAKTISDEMGALFRLIGFSDVKIPESVNLPAPFLGTIETLPTIIEENKIEVVIVNNVDSLGIDKDLLINRLMGLPIRIYLAPDYVRLALLEAEVEKLGNLVLIGLREPVIHGGRRLSKRIMDVAISLILFLLTWPLFIVIWIAIKIDSEGPTIFAASRIGEGGKLFKMYKFRTMRLDAEKMQGDVTQQNELGQKIYKVKHDPRVTRVGSLLRKTSLDELPQLFNVLKGEMSWVGPRPEQPFITKEYETWQWQRVLVPPGVTGWWQISGRSELPMHLNTNYDVYYVRNYSIFLDLKILLKTVFEVFKGRGAY